MPSWHDHVTAAGTDPAPDGPCDCTPDGDRANGPLWRQRGGSPATDAAFDENRENTAGIGLLHHETPSPKLD